MGEAIDTELGMSPLQRTGEADAVPGAVPTCAGLEHQGRASWFLEPYQGIDQVWLLIMKSSTGQKLQRVNPLPLGV